MNRLCATGLVALFLVTMAAGDELWRQDPIQSPGGYSSQDARNPGGLGWFSEVVDNFDAADGWNIENVEFWGGYVTAPGQEGHTEGFTVRVYTDNNGSPGTRIFEQDFADFNETLYGVPFGFGEYQYSIDLSPPLAVGPAGRYWISVVAILARGGTANEPQWGWVQTSGVTGPSAQQWFFSPGNFQPVGVDESFVLNGTVGAACTPCDTNCDGSINQFDIQPFVDALNGGSTCSPCAADSNGDGSLNQFDIQGFVECLANP